MKDAHLKNIREVLDWLIDKFKLERMVYLIATSISLVFLFVCIVLIIKEKGWTISPEIAVMLFGSTGIIGYSVNRLMRMFDQALKIIAEAKESGGKSND